MTPRHRDLYERTDALLFSWWKQVRRFYQPYGGSTMATRRDMQTTKAERRTAAAQRSAPQLRTISERDVEVLTALVAYRERMGARDAWVVPRQIGAGEHTHHANTLVKLERHGLVERKTFAGARRARVLKSRVTDKGRRVLKAIRAAT